MHTALVFSNWKRISGTTKVNGEEKEMQMSLRRTEEKAEMMGKKSNHELNDSQASPLFSMTG